MSRDGPASGRILYIHYLFMTAEKHKSVFFIIGLAHGIEEFQYNEDDLKLLPQGSEFNTFTLWNSKPNTHITRIHIKGRHK